MPQIKIPQIKNAFTGFVPGHPEKTQYEKGKNRDYRPKNIIVQRFVDIVEKATRFLRSRIVVIQMCLAYT